MWCRSYRSKKAATHRLQLVYSGILSIWLFSLAWIPCTHGWFLFLNSLIALKLGRLKRSWAISLRSYELCRRRRLLRATCTRSWDNSGLQGFLRLDSARSWDNLGLRGSPYLDLLDPSRRRSCRQERSTRGIHFHFFPLFWAKYAIWANSNYFVIAIPLLEAFFGLRE